MTQFLTLSLSFNDIFANIRLYTSYLAGKNADSAISYDRIAAIDPDRSLFNVIIEDSASQLALDLGSRVASLTFDGDIIRFVMVNPLWGIDVSRFDTPPTPIDSQLMLSILRSYVTSDAILRWLDVIGADIPAGSTSARQSARSVSSDKLNALKNLLTPPAIPPFSPKAKASPRRIPPIG